MNKSKIWAEKLSCLFNILAETQGPGRGAPPRCDPAREKKIALPPASV